MMFVLLICFIMFTTFRLMNAIIGVVCDSVMNNAEDVQSDQDSSWRLERLEVLKTIETQCFASDDNTDGFVNPLELVRATDHSSVRNEFDHIDSLPLGWDA